jgi:hypothetical protein
MNAIRPYYYLLLLCSTIQAGTPTFINDTDCSVDLNIETSCSGEVIGKHTLTEQDTYHLLSEYNGHALPYNQIFCLTAKPTCKDTLIQNIQTISPYFHENCIIHYQVEKNNEKGLVASPACGAPKTP